MHFGSITLVSAVALLLVMSGCAGGPPPVRAIGEAFVGPAQLKIRADLPMTSETIATVKHGDRLQILQTRRKFLRVRTPDGKEGWTDDRVLLAAADMKALRDLAEHSAKLPTQGVATTYQPLNVHTQPATSSPSFVQLKENEKFDVLQSVMLPRSDAPRTPLIPPVPKKTKAPSRKSAKKEPKIPLPPMPKPPSPPADWVELSRAADQAEEAEPAPIPDAKPAVRLDSWSLVRTATGQTGWVLTRLLYMAIPDEVAQYAEGKRIVSYFSLGQIADGADKKNIWLWTTTTDSHAPWDFDSFRVFVWGLRRHRYETAHIERGIKGYAPVLIQETAYNAKTNAGRYPGFSVCMEKKDGSRTRREYVLIGQTIRFASEQPCEPGPSPVLPQAPSPLPIAATPQQVPKESLFDRLKKRLKLK